MNEREATTTAEIDETQARKTRTEAMKVYSFINKWIANGERSIDK